MARPEVCSLAEEAYTSLGGAPNGEEGGVSVAAGQGEATGWALLKLLHTMLAPLQEIADVVRDGPDGKVGWSTAFDPDTAPASWLRWAGQFYGVRVTPGDHTDPDWVAQARAEVKNAAGLRRGTPAALRGAVAITLPGTKHVTLLERYGSAYRILVRTNASETPDAAATEKAMTSQKPAGIVALYLSSDSPVIDEGTLTIDAVTGATLDTGTLDDIT